jgi:hypothetical protein
MMLKVGCFAFGGSTCDVAALFSAGGAAVGALGTRGSKDGQELGRTSASKPPSRTPRPPGLQARPPLPVLAALHLDICRLRPPQLAALAAGSPRLARLRLAGVAGLNDEALASLTGLSELTELSVVAPHNRWGAVRTAHSGLARPTPPATLRPTRKPLHPPLTGPSTSPRRAGR